MCADETHCSSAFDSVEFVAVIIFTIEYAMRIYAAPEAYPVNMDSYTSSLCKLLLVVVVVLLVLVVMLAVVAAVVGIGVGGCVVIVVGDVAGVGVVTVVAAVIAYFCCFHINKWLQATRLPQDKPSMVVRGEALRRQTRKTTK